MALEKASYVNHFRTAYLPENAKADVPADAPSFQEDPQGAITFYKTMTEEDVIAGKSIDEYRVLQYLDQMTQQEKVAVADYIRNNYQIKLRIPRGKIALAEARDSLEGKMQFVYLEVLFEITPREMFVLLYSLEGKKDDEATAKKEDKDYYVCASADCLPDIQPAIIMGEGEKRVTFYYEKGINIRSPENQGKLKKMYDLIMQANALMPERPVNIVRLSQGGSPPNNCGYEYIDLPLDDQNYLDGLAHELGHSLYNLRQGSKRDEHWEEIYNLSREDRRYELVDESNYKYLQDAFGHPNEDPEEMFASAFGAYLMHPDELIAYIIDPDTPQKTKECGIAIFNYLRDEIFGGKVFCQKDPF